MSLFILKGIKGDSDNIILTVQNCYSQQEKTLTFDIDSFDLKSVCDKFNIFIGDWAKDSVFEYDDDSIGNDDVQPYIFTKVRNTYKPIPIFQLRQDELSEFVYRLLVYKYNSIDRIKTNYARLNYKDLKISKKQYLRQVFNEYCLLRIHFWNSSYYKCTALKNLNKIIVKMLYLKLFN